MKNLLLYLCVMMCCGVSGQSNTVIDSLVRRSAQISDDSNKVYLLDRLSYEYSYIDADAGIRYGKEALDLSLKINWEKGIALSNCDLAINYKAKFENTIALDYAERALKIYQKLGDKNGMAASMSSIVSIHMALGNYAKALAYSFSALRIYEALNDDKHRAIILENIGTIFLEQNELDKAMRYYLSSFEMNKAINDSGALARNMGNIAIIFNAKGKHDSALAYNKVALNINRSLKDKHASQVNLANIANVYLNTRNFHMALKYHHMALDVSKETGHRNCMAINLGNIGETYFELAKDMATDNQYRSSNLVLAVDYLEEAIAICKEISYPAPRLEFMRYLKDAYTLLGEYKKALGTFEAYANLRDSIYSQQSKQTIAQLEANKELGIKTRDLKIKDNQLRIKELELSKKYKERIIYLISIVLFGGVIGIGLKRLDVFKKSNKKLTVKSKEAEDRLVHSEYRLKQAQAIAHIGHWELNYQTGIVIWSEETCRIYGLSPQDNIQSYERWLSFNHPDDLNAVKEVIASSSEKQTPAKFYHRIIRQDGTVRHLYSESYYEYNDLNQPVGMYGIAQDVTEIKEKEEFLRKSNERFELVNQATREAILDWDIVNDLTFWGNGFNEIFGYKPSDYHNHLLSDSMHPEDKEEALRALKDVLDDPTKNLLFRELRLFKADKSITYVQIRTVLIRDSQGKAVRAVSSIRDISDSVKYLKAIEKQNAALREIAWVQSHVIRSPLASIMGLVALLKHKEQYAVDEQDLIDKIQTACEQLNKVIHDVIRKTEAVEHTFQGGSDQEHQ